ncbi:T-cell surface glycoprotein CD3 zeta chain-like [Megalops cyprinoides]|uniref:T-cell surface glycoprotein CD3 zeta chain-like n=1 Tax=Megalops cyprinoides TaxID=118141 RepID=UPI0018649D85|nr:T-cell surface glycoprotein CD3 zeta chain-like [Megalops cyprinoides]
MDLRRTGALVFLALVVPTAGSEPANALNNPMLCYILDGVLLVYGLVVTALFFRERFFKPAAVSTDDPVYMGLNKPGDQYEELRRRNDPEGGAARANRRQGTEETYTRLQKTTEDAYKEIGVKKERRGKREQVYQGLSAATKDTYDSLQMQSVPPPPPR